jgi:hypothetical protein
MHSEKKDNLITIAAIGLIAYVSADFAHHALGHGGACLALGGKIKSLSSIFVDCSLRGTAIDLAGPIANLVLGLIALLVVRFLNSPSTTRLFFILVAAFNLFWIELQFVFSAATKTDDWAWAIKQLSINDLCRYSMVVVGILIYIITIRIIANLITPFAQLSVRVKIIVAITWIAAGVIAIATAVFDAHPLTALLQSAVPQSLLLAIGLLFLPRAALEFSVKKKVALPIEFSFAWVGAAAIIAILSILFLGPGFSVSI